MPRPRPERAAFSLVELLVVVGIVALLIGVLLPTLGRARDAALDAVCATNLRQCFTASAAFASAYDGLGPAIGRPYAATPNWALVVQQAAGAAGEGASTYREQSVLVCPLAARALDAPLTRSYAMNAAGHNRRSWNADPDSFDDEIPPGAAHVGVRFSRVANPSRASLLVDGARNAQQPPLPPDRCASVVDFRPDAAMGDRIGRWHAAPAGDPAAGATGGRGFNAATLDGAVARFADPPGWFEDPLP